MVIVSVVLGLGICLVCQGKLFCMFMYFVCVPRSQNVGEAQVQRGCPIFHECQVCWLEMYMITVQCMHYKFQSFSQHRTTDYGRIFYWSLYCYKSGKVEGQQHPFGICQKNLGALRPRLGLFTTMSQGPSRDCCLWVAFRHYTHLDKDEKHL